MTNEQIQKNEDDAMESAWQALKPELDPSKWTTGESFTYRGFFCWGWEARRQYDSDQIDALIHDNKRLYESLNSEASERCRLEDEVERLLEAVKEVDVLIRNELPLDRTTPAWKMIKEILYRPPYPIDAALKEQK